MPKNRKYPSFYGNQGCHKQIICYAGTCLGSLFGTLVPTGNGSVQVAVFSSKIIYQIWQRPSGTIIFWVGGSNCVTFYVTIHISEWSQ